jgi:cytochrome c oxidase subunit III
VSIVLLFLTVLAVIAGWWLSRQRLGAKPWLETGLSGGFADGDAYRLPAAKIGLGIFLAVVGSLFALLISAYSMRMRSTDWVSLPEIKLLWLNTGLLIASSVALQSAATFARRGQMDSVVASLAAGAISATAFLFGQLMVWRQLSDAGLYAAANPASAFFYLVTAIHALHLLGGLVALARVTVKMWSEDQDVEKVRAGIALCAMYWHFLLLIWVILFSILFLGAWSEWLYAICFGT